MSINGLIDTHCHLQFSQFDDDRAEMIMRAHQVGVTHFVVPGVTAASWPQQRDYAQRYQHWFNAFGLHPYFIDEHRDAHLRQLVDELERGGAVAVGEIGLDATCGDMDKQRQLFEQQLKLAAKFQLPVILHHRKTLDEMLQRVRDSGLLESLQNRRVPGVVHAFSGSEQQAQAWVDAGFKLGIGGVITYERANKTRNAVAAMPVEALVLETDSPDMPTAGKQGERNEPAYMTRVFDALCELRSENPHQLRLVLRKNSQALFRLDGVEPAP